MIFVPSKDGRSHCAEEFTADSEMRAGADVLLNTILALDTQLAT
jgi:N-carbamoyl-L-amino-acid hydrolase